MQNNPMHYRTREIVSLIDAEYDTIVDLKMHSVDAILGYGNATRCGGSAGQ